MSKNYFNDYQQRFHEKNYVQLLRQLGIQHRSLSSQINPHHAYPAQSLKIHFNIILLNLSLPNGHFPSDFSTRILCSPLLSLPPYVPFHSSRSDTPKTILGGGVTHHKAAHYKISSKNKKIVGVNNLDGLSAH